MPITLDTLTRWLQAPAETERLEFKEAKQQFDSAKLMRYFILSSKCLPVRRARRWTSRAPT